jgi:putative flippase GtrA
VGRFDRVLRFLVVGGVAFVVDVGLFNLLVHGPDGGVLNDRPIAAKVVATGASMLVSYYGNKLWTYVAHESSTPLRQTAAFLVVNAVAWGLNLAPLAVSRYVLGLDSVLADNVAGNVIGVALALVFRFWAYGRYVFPSAPSAPSAHA